MGYKKNNRGSYVLKGQDGEQFTVTPKEYKELQTLVKRANQRRVDVAHRYYDDISNTDIMTGISYEGYMDLLQNKGFITEKYSTTLRKFNSKKDVKSLLKELNQVTKRGYGSDRVENVRHKMLEQIKENYGNDGQELYDKIETMDKADFLSLYLNSDREIVSNLFYLTDDVKAMAEKSLTHIETILVNSSSDNKSHKTSKKSWKSFKQKQKRKKI